MKTKSKIKPVRHTRADLLKRLVKLTGISGGKRVSSVLTRRQMLELLAHVQHLQQNGNAP